MGAPFVLGFVENLFFRLPIEDAIRRVGGEGFFAASPDDFVRALVEKRPNLAIVSLEAAAGAWDRCIQEAQGAGVPVIAFGPHDDLEARAKALAAGAQAVYAKGKFTADLPKLIVRHLGRAEGPGPQSDEVATVAP
jgi:DNA-binding response OmpR family regulator